MALKECLLVGFFWIAILAPLSLSDIFEVHSPPLVIGDVDQDAILPCQISLGTLPQNMEVQWKKIGEDRVDSIYEYSAVTGQEAFGLKYQGRIGLVKEGTGTGNVSLKMKEVQVTDEGTYSCIVKSVLWSADTQMVLRVTALGTVSIEVLGPESEGIKLACRSEGWFPKPELHWLAKNSQNPQIQTRQDHKQLFSVYSTITVMKDPGEITCSVHEKSYLQKKQEVTILLSENSFKHASPWLLAFWVSLVLNILAVIILMYFLYKGIQKKKLKKQTKEQGLLQEIISKTMKSGIQDIQIRLERAQTELDFRKARSYLTHIRLDPTFKHPDLVTSTDTNDIHISYKCTSSGATVTSWPLIIMGIVGYKEGRQYWEVRVDDKPKWELGVVTESTRVQLRSGKNDTSHEGQCWSLRKSNGKYYPEEADSEIRKYTFPLQAVGIFLDMEDHFISFYDVKGMKLIVKIPIEASERLYPFFSPGIPEEEDKGKPLIICQEKDWDFPLQL